MLRVPIQITCPDCDLIFFTATRNVTCLRCECEFDLTKEGYVIEEGVVSDSETVSTGESSSEEEDSASDSDMDTDHEVSSLKKFGDEEEEEAADSDFEVGAAAATVTVSHRPVTRSQSKIKSS